MGKPYTTYQKELAFDVYYAMGAARELCGLSAVLEGTEYFLDRVPKKTALKKWSSEEKWQSRIKQRDIENSSKVQAKTDREVVRTKAEYRDYIGKQLKDTSLIEQRVAKLIEGATKLIKTKKLKVATIKELNELSQTHVKLKTLELQLIKADLLLIGESDITIEHIIEVVGVDFKDYPKQKS